MVSVVHNEVEKSWFIKPSRDSIESVLKKYRIPKNYVISVGTIQPRKNFEFLIDAFRYMPEETRKNLTLVIVGKRGANSKDICAKFKQQEEAGSFVWLDYVLQEELQILVAGAKAMAFPSLAEIRNASDQHLLLEHL